MNAIDYTARADNMLGRVVELILPRLPDDLTPDDITGFIDRYRPQLVKGLATALQARDRRRGKGGPPGLRPAPPADVGPDLSRSRERAEANLEAMRILAGRRSGQPVTAAQRAALERYSGWGGIGLAAWQGRFPPGLAVDPQALIHEYYTPSEVTRAVGAAVERLLPTLPSRRALEPSAGIGRYVRDAPAGLDWTAVEFSPVSAGILGAIRPDVDLTVGTFEAWVARRGGERFGLVLSNPPYGARGGSFVEDPDRATHRIKDAYIYFLLRTAGLLEPGGVGVYLIPRGFMDGRTPQHARVREALLRSHHLMAAFRLPSNDPARGAEGDLFPGANIVVDLVFLRARPGVLGAVDEADAFIAAGDYFVQTPKHVLGREVIQQDEKTGRRARFGGYEVHGRFAGLPAWEERPICAACVVAAPAPRGATAAAPVDLEEDEALGAARQLGDRVEAYLAAVRDAPENAVRLHGDLVAAIEGWVAAFGLPRAVPTVVAALRARDERVRRFVEVVAGEKAALPPPPVSTKALYTAAPVDIAAWWFAQHGALTLAEVIAEHRRMGGRLTPTAIHDALVGAGWCFDGDGWDQLVPERVYLSGHLYPKLDRALAKAKAGNAAAVRQVAALRKAIRPAALADIENLEPRQSWLPIEVIEAYVNDTTLGRYGTRVRLARKKGLLTLADEEYDDLANTKEGRKGSGYTVETLSFLGWANHDPVMFKPVTKDLGGGDTESLDEARVRVAEEQRKAFAAWLEAHPAHADVVVERYNRKFRGYVEAPRITRPLNLSRWRNVNLHPYQVDSAQRIIGARRGLLALDVGLGKTYTALSVIAAARQEGWARRPVLLVPNTLVWKWKRDVACVLPDYRSVVIGSELYRARDGGVRSRTDSADARGKKWTAFRAGAYDVAIVAYSVFHRTKMRPGPIEAYVEELEAVQRTVALRRRNIKRSQEGKKPKDLTEREEAILREGAKAWVAEKLQLPPGQSYDTGVWWDDIGVDLLVVDEAQNFKNLYMPEEREGGVPDYMGNPGEGSDRAWNLDFRAASVRRRTGGAGVVLLSATPAKNSPLEIYNALQLIDPQLMLRAGITDPEHFIDRFCGFTPREAEDVTGKSKIRQSCTSFVNLHELRDLLYSVADYKTAAEVGLRLPDPATHLVDVQLDDHAKQLVAKAIAEIEQIEEDRAEAAQQRRTSAVTALTMKILGVKMRIAMLGIHGSLPGANEGGKRPDQNPGILSTNPHSGKIDACVRNVVARKGCGHIIFCDFIAAHVWMKRALVEAGIPEARIAVLNAPMVPDTEARQRIAMGFNGSEPDDGSKKASPCGKVQGEEFQAPIYDVVIANAVAYEGVDLQRRTCAIHHLDLPWEPATLHQRNGRGVRQGNKAGTVDLFYYLAVGTGDRERLDKIRGKAGWMNALSDKNARETANPAAQLSEDGWDDFIVRHSRNPEAAKGRIEAKRAAAAEAARARRELQVRRLLRAANDLFRRAERLRESDPAEAATALAEAERRLESVLQADAVTFPWGPFASVVRSRPVYIGDTGPLLYDGLTTERIRIGRVFSGDAGPVIGVHGLLGRPAWAARSPAEVPAFTAADVRTVEPPSQVERDQRAADAVHNQRLRFLQLHLADDQWLAWWWPSFRRALSSSEGFAPVRDEEGVHGGYVAGIGDSVFVYPPSADGYARWVDDVARSNVIPFREADEITRAWWGRGLPQDAYARVRGGG